MKFSNTYFYGFFRGDVSSSQTLSEDVSLIFGTVRNDSHDKSL